MKVLAWYSERTEDVLLCLGPHEATLILNWIAELKGKGWIVPPVVVQVEAQLAEAQAKVPGYLR